MASTYTTSLRVELQTTGENRSTWGTKANGSLNHLEDGIAGYTTIAMGDSNHTLTTNNGSDDEARNAIIDFTGAHTATRTVTIPAVPKVYVLRNSTTGGFDLTIDNGTNTVTLANGEWQHVWTDGTTMETTGSMAAQYANNVAITGGSVTGITDITVADGGTGASTAGDARTNLGLVIGTDVQAQDDILDDLSGLTQATDKLPYFDSATTMATTDLTAFARTVLDDTTQAAAKTTLGVADTDVIDLIYPVGSIYITTSATNPGTLFTGTTWAAFAAGRAVVGVGSNGESSWTEGQTAGSETHTLTESEIPSHTHDAGTLATASDGAHTHSISYKNRNFGNSGNDAADLTASGNTKTTASNGAHTHTITGSTGSAGSGAAHNNIQPSVGVYMWERTA